MATPFPFTTGQVLTAAQLNAITELIINDKTDSYTLVAGDAGERVIMNKSSATTLTVPDAVFVAGQIVEILNKGSGTCTVTAGSGVTLNGSGTALGQYKAGTLLALSPSTFVFIASGSAMQTQVTAFTASGTFTPPTGVTYAVAHILAGGGGVGASAGAGGTSSVAFAGGTVSATGGTVAAFTAYTGTGGQGVAGVANSGKGASGIGNRATGDEGYTIIAGDGAYIVAGGAVTAGVGITVTVGAGGTAGTNGAAGGSGYVWIEYQVAV